MSNVLEDWQQRVIDERDELESKMQKVHMFMTTSKEYQKIAYEQQELIRRQYSCMNDYYKILGARITTFILGE